jgi:hypothetical protein
MRIFLILRVAGAVACFCAMVTFVLWGLLTNFERVEQVNSKLPPEKHFDPIWWGPFKKLRFEEEYERFFPDRALRKKERILMLLAVISIFAGVACMAPLLR